MEKKQAMKQRILKALLIMMVCFGSALAGAAVTPHTTPFTVRRWTGDFDDMIKRRVIRALVVPPKTQYWVDRGNYTGVEYELLHAFENEINKKYKTNNKNIKIHIVFIPSSRGDLIPGLNEGRGDIAAGLLTVTPERLEQVDFGEPFFHGVKEVAVTGPKSPALASINDLSGKEVIIRKSSSYCEHLELLNERFRREGKALIRLRAAPEDLQDDDLLEMLNAGLIGITVVDRYVALLWANVFKNITPREDLAVNEGGEIGWMIRKNSPKLKAEISAFAKSYGQGTVFGNTVIKKYTGSARFVKNAASEGEMKKFRQAIDFFQKYGRQYDLDYLLMAAQGYQESRLDQNAKSRVGAIGVMQVMPATGKDLKVGDITELESNIHAGVKYFRFMINQYFANDPMDPLNKGLFAFAAYNAGPRRIKELRSLAEKRGLNPNIWFNNVELIAAEKIGPETVTYVSNIYKYFIAYKLIQENEEDRQKGIETLKNEVGK